MTAALTDPKMCACGLAPVAASGPAAEAKQCQICYDIKCWAQVLVKAGAS